MTCPDLVTRPDSAAQPDLAVIVVSWMSREHLARCLDSIRRSRGGLDVETWVVDNASTDGSAELVAGSYPGVRLVVNRENVGFSRAVNQALRVARGRHVLLMNPDSEAVGTALADMVAFMEANPRTGIAGGRVENADGTLQSVCRRRLPTPRRMLWRATGLTLLLPRVRFLGDYVMDDQPEDRPHPAEAVSGSFLMIRRETLEAIGLLDERFFMYGEDLDWCARAAAAGWQVMYNPAARMTHIHRASSRKNRARTIRALHESGEIYCRKHLMTPRSRPLIALVIAALRLRCALLLAGARLETLLRRGRKAPAENHMEGAALVRDLR